MNQLPKAPSEATRRRNPHLWPGDGQTPQSAANQATGVKTDSPKRIRQSSKPLMNKLEAEFHARLSTVLCEAKDIHVQAIKFRLANGLTYTPDFVVLGPLAKLAFEVKGKWFTDDSNAKLKMAASLYPEIEWWLVWKDDAGKWQKQQVLSDSFPAPKSAIEVETTKGTKTK